jgi:hypothetical protein
MDPNLALAGLIIAVALANWWNTKATAKRLALAVERAAAIQNQKLADIYRVADGRYADALQTIEDLKGLLVEGLDAQNPRIKQAIVKNS